MSGAPVPGEEERFELVGSDAQGGRDPLSGLFAPHLPVVEAMEAPGAVSVLESQREGLRLIVPGEEERRQRVFVPSRGISPPLPFGQGLDAEVADDAGA